MFSLDHISNRKKHYKRIHEFLVEPGNQLAYDIVQNLIAHPETMEYNPLLLFGPLGCGKTHLLEAVYREMQKNGKHRILYLKAEQFHYCYTQSVRHSQFQKFRDSCRNCRFLLFDNLHVLRNKKQTQCELLFTINELFSKNCLLIFSSRYHLKELAGFNRALLNRFESGLIIKLSPISTKKVLAYFQTIADRFSFQLPREMLEASLAKHQISFGEFKKHFEKLLLFCATNKQQITRQLLDGFMNRYYQENRLTKENILQVVAAHYQLEDWQKLCEKGGGRLWKEPRYVAIALVREILGKNNRQLCEEFGGRSESSVRYALKEVSSSHLQEVCQQLREQIKGTDAISEEWVTDA